MGISGNEQLVLRSLTIIHGDGPSELIRFAAEEIRGYVWRLAGFSPEILPPGEWKARANTPVILVGSPSNNPLIAEALGKGPWPKLSDQGFVLRRARLHGQPVLIVGADTPIATLWAAYELIARWGVTFTPRGDILPVAQVELTLPNVDLVAEPVIRLRGWRVLNCEVNGMEFWGLDDYRKLISQLAKLKYNMLTAFIYPYGPWVDYQFHGIRKSTSELNFGLRYPLHDGMIGRELLGDADEFTNPEFRGLTTHPEKHEAARRLIRGIMDHARRLGMKTGLLFMSPIEATNEFRFPFKDWTDVPDDPARDVDPDAPMFTLGEVLFGTDPNNTKHQNVEDPLVQELGATVLKAHLDAYPDLDYYFIGQSEFRASATDFRRCWDYLDRKYDIRSVASLESLIAEASERGGKSAVRKLKADIEHLFLLDRLTNEMKVQATSGNPDAKLYYYQLEQALYPVLVKVLAKTGRGFIADMMRGYSKPWLDGENVRAFGPFAGSGVPFQLKWTPQTDAHSMLLQVRLTPLRETILGLRDTGAEGYQVCYWVLGDFVPAASYISRLSWDPNITPEQFWREYLTPILGSQAVPSAMEGLRILDEGTGFAFWKINAGFPMPMVFKIHFEEGKPDPRLDAKRRYYEDALPALHRAYWEASPEGQAFLNYFITRAEYSVLLLRCFSDLEHAGEMYRKLADARQRRDGQGYFSLHRQILRLLDGALAIAEKAARVLTPIVQDQCDRGALVVTNLYGIDYIRSLRHIIWLDATSWHWT